jgi:2-succinyl-6-hydroxy-2,4-cyclohexadiene-1-carboxylate synthase
MIHNKQIMIYFAPGFLGKPEDGALFNQFGFSVENLDFFSKQGLFIKVLNCQQEPELFFDLIADSIHNYIQTSSAAMKKVLIGYSLGGRIMAHVFLKNPNQYEKLILISSHLGLRDHNERMARKITDGSWAQRFLSDPWTNVMHSWNKQAVFSHSKEVARHEIDFDRKALAAAFSHAGLGMQKNLEAALLEFKKKVIFIAGDQDQKFSDLAKSYADAGFHSKVIRNCGHRVLLDQPMELLNCIESFCGIA